jgi:hypothetical protein
MIENKILLRLVYVQLRVFVKNSIPNAILDGIRIDYSTIATIAHVHTHTHRIILLKSKCYFWEP